MRRADRLFKLLFLLADGRITTAQTLARSLEVSERTIYRDMADLAASGVPLDGEAGVGYRLRKGFRLPPLMFDMDELHALLLGSCMVKGWTDPALGAAAESAMAKIVSVLPPGRESVARDQSLLVPDFHVDTGELAPMGPLRQAINDEAKVRLDYVRADGEPSQRVVWPLTLVFWGSTWTLGGWCELRQTFRSFRVDRIQQWAVLPAHFDGKGGGLLRDFLRAVSEGEQCAL